MKRSDLIFVLFATVILVVAWIAFSIEQRLNTSTLAQTVTVQATPITPAFDMKTLSSLQERIAITPIQELAQAPIATPTALPTLAPTPIPTPFLIITTQSSQSATTQASSGGQLQ